MKRVLTRIAAAVLLPIAIGAVLMLLVQGRGVSARPDPPALEARGALWLRSWMTPATYKGLKNPVSATEENFIAAREHYADHCASCHANDGSGNTEMGRNFYPKSPDMRLPRTQQLSDGEIFYFIENGIRMTGMPAWSSGTPEGEKSSWQLVHFIRRLPTLTAEDFAVMERFNPTSRAQIDEERAVEEFLDGGRGRPAPPDPHAGHGKQ